MRNRTRPMNDESRDQFPSSLAGEGGGETILVVEDDAGVRALACAILSAHGYRVLEAADPEAALSIARRHQPIHLSLLDLAMPGMGGVELARRLRGRLPTARVLYMSGYATVATISPDMEDAFIQKPFDRAVLLQTVRRALDSDHGASK